MSDQTTCLTDEEALKKANSKDWFDNKAGQVQWIKPRKSGAKANNRPDLNSMSVEELQNQYVLALEQLKVFGSVPDEAKALVSEKLNKLVSYMMAIRLVIKSKANPEQNTFFDEFEKLRKKASSKSSNVAEVASLKIRINDLTQQLESIKKARSKEKEAIKQRNIELSNQRNLIIYNEFKTLVKEKVGEVAYFSLIQEADAIAELKINSLKA